MPNATPALSAADQRAYERNLPKYYLFVLISELQLWFPIWVAFLILKRELSLTEIAVIDAPFWLLVVFAEVPTGAVADRWERSTSLWLGAFVYAGRVAGLRRCADARVDHGGVRDLGGSSHLHLGRRQRVDLRHPEGAGPRRGVRKTRRAGYGGSLSRGHDRGLGGRGPSRKRPAWRHPFSSAPPS